MFLTNIVQKLEILILCTITFLENHAVYEIMWKYAVERGRSQLTTWSKRTAYSLPKATNTHTHTQTHTHTHTQIIKYSLLFHCNNSFADTPQCYVIRILQV
jgi:hypothetical protein